MKIYEALKEMIENGKTIKDDFYHYKSPKVDWADGGLVVLVNKREKWQIGSIPINHSNLMKDWQIVEEDSNG